MAERKPVRPVPSRLGVDLSNFEVDPDSGLAVPPASPIENLVVPEHIAQDYASKKLREAEGRLEEKLAAEMKEMEEAAKRARISETLMKTRRLNVAQYPSTTRKTCQARLEKTTGGFTNCGRKAEFGIKVESKVKRGRKKGGGLFAGGNHGAKKSACWDHLPPNVQNWLRDQGKAPESDQENKDKRTAQAIAIASHKEIDFARLMKPSGK